MSEKNPAERLCITYMLRCSDGSLYSGWTNDLPRRLRAHNAGTGARYTRSRRPVELVWTQAFPTRHEAMALEARLKRMTKGRKEALILADTPIAEQSCIEEP